MDGDRTQRGEAGWARSRLEGSVAVVDLGGRWTLAHARTLEETLGRVDTKGAAALRIDFGAVAAIDTGGAWLLHRQILRWQEAGDEIELVRASHAQTALLERMSIENEVRMSLARPGEGAVRELVIRAGEATVEFGREAHALSLIHI